MKDFNPSFLIIIMFAVSLVPVMMGIATSYLKVSIVLGLFKNALGAQQVPGPLIIMAISLALTMLIMQPVLTESAASIGSIDFAKIQNKSVGDVFLKFLPAIAPIRIFLENNTGSHELNTVKSFTAINKGKDTNSNSQISWAELLTAFMLTELKEAFLAGFAIMFPFLLVDLIVANLLAGLSLQMVSPVMVSLPLKIILIVWLDAWLLIFRGLFYAYA